MNLEFPLHVLDFNLFFFYHNSILIHLENISLYPCAFMMFFPGYQNITIYLKHMIFYWIPIHGTMRLDEQCFFSFKLLLIHILCIYNEKSLNIFIQEISL